MGNCANTRPPCGDATLVCAEGLCQRQGLGALHWQGSVEPSVLWTESGMWQKSLELDGLPKVVECCQPLLFEIVGYLAHSPKDFAQLCGMSAHFVAIQMRPVANSIWKGMYAQRWPAFHDCLAFHHSRDWCHLYRETLNGRLECTLEVFDREKKLGFAMAAMPAHVQYEARLDAYVARYLSASEVPPEKIPPYEEHRLRFCPESVRAKLLSPRASEHADAKIDRVDSFRENRHGGVQYYPYRVLEGTAGLEVGTGVELQWKMQEGSPFGWWYGQLDSLTHSSDGLAQATITFRHFPATSRWYRLDVLFGDSMMRDCAFGGYTGGIRAVSEAEKAQCMKFFPREPVIF